MNFTFARYKRRFVLEGTHCEVIIRAKADGLYSELWIAGEMRAHDYTPAMGPEATRNHRLVAALPDGSELEVEAGYISWVNVGIGVRHMGHLVHESHPGRTIAFPASAAKMASDPAIDMNRYKANKVPITVDIALGLLFFILAKLTDLTTAAIVGAIVGIALVVVQRFIKIDITGGLALFGVLLLLISGGLAIAFQDDMAVKMRGTIVGGISAILFLGDGLLGGNRLGKALARYLPYDDLDISRLAIGMGVLGLVMAALNIVVALFTSTDIWLFYTTFGDFAVTMILILAVFRYARGQLFAATATGRSR